MGKKPDWILKPASTTPNLDLAMAIMIGLDAVWCIYWGYSDIAALCGFFLGYYACERFDRKVGIHIPRVKAINFVHDDASNQESHPMTPP